MSTRTHLGFKVEAYKYREPNFNDAPMKGAKGTGDAWISLANVVGRVQVVPRYYLEQLAMFTTGRADVERYEG